VSRKVIEIVQGIKATYITKLAKRKIILSELSVDPTQIILDILLSLHAAV